MQHQAFEISELTYQNCHFVYSLPKKITEIFTLILQISDTVITAGGILKALYVNIMFYCVHIYFKVFHVKQVIHLEKVCLVLHPLLRRRKSLKNVL